MIYQSSAAKTFDSVVPASPGGIRHDQGSL